MIVTLCLKKWTTDIFLSFLAENLRQEGLFRLSPSSSLLQEVKQKLDRGQNAPIFVI